MTMVTLKKTGIRSAIQVALTGAVVIAAAPWARRPVEAKAGAPQVVVADTDAIRNLISRYAKSIDDADIARGSEVWSKSPEVSFIHPLGHEHGWEQVKRNFYEKTMGAIFSERKLTVRDVKVHILEDAAWAEFYWDFAAKFGEGGKPLTTKGRETQIYRKVDNRWELVHVHYSGMPVTERGQGF